MNQPASFTSSDFSLDRVTQHASSRQSQSFGRFEFKYLLTAPIRALLEAELRDFMEIDPFCRNRPEQSYRVRSLYFDDPDFHAYHEKIDGMLHREKFRLRTYDAPGSAPWFLEVKGRQNQYSYKHRSILDAPLRRLIAERRWSALAGAETGSTVIRRFGAVACRRNLLPQVVVEYTRRPYVGRRDYRFRVTFDDTIHARHSPSLDQLAAPSSPVLRQLSVLEIKFEHALPAWFQRLIGTYEIQRVSISKYCRSAEALTVVRNLE